MTAPATMGFETVHAVLREHHEEILRSWEELVVAEERRVELAGLALRDSLPAFLDELAAWLQSGAPTGEQKLGAQSLKHVIDRLDHGFELGQVLREYRLFREAVLRCVLEAEQGEQARTGTKGDAERKKRIVELARLNAGLDVAISGSIEEFVAERDRRAEEELQESGRTHAFHSAVLAAVRDPMWATDPELRIVYWNDAATAAFGWTADEVMGRNTHELLETVVLGSTCEDAVARLRRTGEYFGEVVCQRKDGSPIVLEASSRQVRGPDGQVVRVVSTARDITQRKQAEEALREGEARERRVNELFNAAVEASPVILFTQDGELRYTWLPQPVPGYRPEDVIGRTDYEVLERREDAAAFVALKRRALETGQAVRDVVPALHEGVTRWYDIHVKPQRGAGGDMVGVLVAAVDVTERKLAEEAVQASNARLAAILEQLPAAISVLAMDGTVILGNSALTALQITRPPSQDPAQRHRWSAEDEQGRPIPPTAWPGARALRGEAVNPGMKFRHRRSDGKETQHVVSSVPLRDVQGRQTGAVVVIQDVTLLAEGEEQRLAAATALEAANARLRDADRRKNEFLAVLSHELRNPLAPIRNSIYLLDHAAPGSERFVRARDVIERQTNHLARLVDDLLDVVRITRGRVNLQRERVDLRELVRHAMDAVRPTFAQAGIELRVEHALGPTWLDADPTRVAQVIGNLLHNAQKFTPAGGTVTVSLESGDGKAFLRVKDTGVGMEPGREQEMFEAFAQGDQGLARTRGGLGLGLSLVKLFVELHGGAVSAKSEGKGRGSEFVVTLPLATTEAPQTGSGRSRGSPARRVLVIEDNADGAQTLADVLALDGHVVQVAHSGGEGVAMARDHRPDVILCDVGLPDIDGYEVARQVRAIPGLEGVRLFALTGYAQPEDQERAKQAGFDAHLAKPPDAEGLLRALSAEG